MSQQTFDDLLELEPFNPGYISRDPFGLIGSRCKHCGYATFPQRNFCPQCRNSDAETEVVPLSPYGRIHTFTVIRQAPPGTPVPYVLAQVDLDDGCRVIAQCLTESPDELEINDRVEVQPAEFRSRANEAVLGYKFRLISEEIA